VKRKWKIIITVAALLIAAIGVYASTVYSKRGVVTVQTGKVVRQDLTSLVTASGEIKPKNYINIGANAMGDITELLVKEGDRVRKGQLLARIENTQPAADVESQKANLSSAEADANAAEAGLKAADDNLATMQGAITQSKADLDRMKADYQRAESLFKEGLGAKQDYEGKEIHLRRPGGGRAADRGAPHPGAVATRTNRGTAYRHPAADHSGPRRPGQDQRYSTQVRLLRPLDGVVTNLPVRAGETVVPGLQNQTGTEIMTIADMSLITAEVKVDETDIVNVKLDQTAEITIDAIPNKTFKGHVTEMGNTAILRSPAWRLRKVLFPARKPKDF